MDDLVNRLTIKASVMEMGEKIAWGSDTSLMREAANRIEWMGERLDITQARIAELEAAQRWIPVWERWPRAEQRVLIFDGHHCIHLVGDHKRYTFTHWRPLPPPPEAGE